MKNVWSCFAAIALVVGCAGLVQADELSPKVLDIPSFITLQGDLAPMTSAIEQSAAMGPHTSAICQPGTYQNICKEIWGTAQGRCGANTWRWTQCKQYKNSAGKWYYQECGLVNETCTPPGGAECIPCL